MSYRIARPGTLASLQRLVSCLFIVVCFANRANAAGIEDTVGGTVGLGRAAYFARVNDFMAIMQNPANLAVAPGGKIGGNFGLELRLPVLTACFDRARAEGIMYKDPGSSTGYQGRESFDKVCNDAYPGPTANLGWVQSFDDKWGYGIGVFTPAAVGSSKYGRDTIVTVLPRDDEQYTPTLTGTESPNRQLALERDGAIAFAMLGLAAAPLPTLRFGVSVGWGFGNVYNKSVVSVLGGTFTDQEVINELRVRDRVIPKMTGSVVITPLPWLDLFAVGNYQGDLEGKGEIKLTANGISGAPLRSCGAENPGSRCKIPDVRLRVPFPTMEAVFGARISVPRAGKKGRVLDPMKDEYLDMELDVSWAQTSKVEEFKVNIHDKRVTDPGSPKVQFANAPADADPPVERSPIRQTTSIPKNWKDTWTVRAGGDLNLVPGRFTVRGGISFATSAVDPRNMNIDYWPVRKLGLHAGATIGITERIKVHLAYAHLFYQDTVVLTGTGNVKDIASINEVAATAVNEGSYRAGLDVFSAQLNAAF
jgi:hypothetical protein